MTAAASQSSQSTGAMSSASSNTSSSSLLESTTSAFSRDTSPGLHRPFSSLNEGCWDKPDHAANRGLAAVADSTLSPPNLCRDALAQSTGEREFDSSSSAAPTARTTAASSSSSSSVPDYFVPTIPSGTSVSSTYSTSSAVSDSSSSGGEEGVSPPPNFAEVVPGLYRSSFPRPKHFAFVRSLGLKTVLTFVQDEYPADVLSFYKEEGIRFVQLGMPGNKEDDMRIPNESIEKALSLVVDSGNYPMLLHCNKGKHRTGVIVGCLRRLQRMPLDDLLQEYRHFSFPKCRTSDQHCIAQFPLELVTASMHHPPPQWINTSDAPTLFDRPASLGQLVQRDSDSTVITCHQQTLCEDLPETTDAVSQST